ncbi:unnamed protein product [Clonostachys rosea]|uniref:Xylanolytic transcriptional activator regulatory domain-containing protein n=1 Tax=Bionectria ochroleuca TaxID=29856 RepID=A0ABY6TQH9_BIOOC|nr:unnamed protein product [Clonostachys rosea]
MPQTYPGPAQGTAGGIGTVNFTRPIAPAEPMHLNLERQSSPAGPSVEMPLGLPTPQMDREDVLPPPGEVLEGCTVFVTSYFQLGFIPKDSFLNTLKNNFNSANKFLLACILSISARFTPSLVQRYGGPASATNHFLEVSKAMAPSEMYQPSVERTQAFFLLAISQWGNGDRARSSIDMGIAVRMAFFLKLNREETYSTMHDAVRSESARRVFWMIQSQENLHSGYGTPAPFPLESITTMLPCNELDFASGVIPPERAALPGTRSALIAPTLVYAESRCLFATLIQAHSLWGSVARRARRSDRLVSRLPPWDYQSEFHQSTGDLHAWEAALPDSHAFTEENLMVWKAEDMHLAYLSVTMVLRLSNIVIRRIYLHDMLAELSPGDGNQPLEPETSTMGNENDDQHSPITPTYGVSPQGFWKGMSHTLFQNVWQLHEQIAAYFNMRSPDEGFPQILVFCVYVCGSLSYYLMRYPALCPMLSPLAGSMAQKCSEVLTELHRAWPTSSNWQRGLQRIATPTHTMSPVTDVETPLRTPGNMDQTPVPSMLQIPGNFQQQGQGAMDSFLNEQLEFEAFLQRDPDFNFLGQVGL